MKLVKTLIIGALSLAGFVFAEAEIGGYCPVCYLSAGKAVKGTEEFKSEYKGGTYLFVSEQAKSAFDATPEKFLPMYGGYCAYGISLGKKFEVNPDYFAVVNGMIYLNSGKEAQAAFDKNPEAVIEKANAEWAKLMKK